MLKNMSQLEHVIGDKVYHFVCDQTSPLNEIKDALFQFLKYVGQVEDAIKAQQAVAPPVEAPGDPVSPVQDDASKVQPLEQPKE